jgi:hypothetical protein
VDCGGSAAPACANGKGCVVATDCQSDVCKGGTCQAPSHTDGVKNGDETGVDCGGPTAPKCAVGQGCKTSADCNNSLCDAGKTNVCLPPSHMDGLKNGDETGIDCGGATAPKCAVGQGCKTNADCNNVLCDAGKTNVCLPPSHTDGLKNGDETGVDCGGPTAPNKCPTGQGCVTNADCNNVACDGGKTNVCLAPSHADGIKNGDETGVDCGGPTAPNKCPTGQGCVTTADCNNLLCDVGKTNLCSPPSSNDGFKNGTETDVDCGGGAPTNAPACGVNKGCLANTDCTTSGCAYNNKCAPAPSCVPHYGGDTCGRGEPGAADAKHESCCSSVTLPNSAVKVDKYEITAGRMREFVTRVGGNVQGWVQTHRAQTTQIADNMVQYLPIDNLQPQMQITQCNGAGQNCQTVNESFGTSVHLGNHVFMNDRPCPNCGQGCYIGSIANGGYGHPTYWQPDATQDLFMAEHRLFSQQELDPKSLNCTTQLMFAAFCAWDGGRLPTQAELGSVNGAWGPTTYPWGSADPGDVWPGTPAAMRTAYPYNTGVFLVPSALADGTSNLANSTTYNVTNWNPFSPYLPYFRYSYPAVNVNKWDQTDQAYAVAAPGRMVNDFRYVGPNPTDGYYDVGANIMEVTGTIVGNDDATHNSWPLAQWVGGSFEGHGVNNRGGYNLSIMTKYGKQGARCAR